MIAIDSIIIEIIKHLPGQHRQLNHAGGTATKDLTLPFSKEDLDTINAAWKHHTGHVWTGTSFMKEALNAYPYLAIDTVSILQKGENVEEEIVNLFDLAKRLYNEQNSEVTAEIVNKVGEFPPYVTVLKTKNYEKLKVGHYDRAHWDGYAKGIDPYTDLPFIMTSALWHRHDGFDEPAGTIEFRGFSRITKGYERGR